MTGSTDRDVNAVAAIDAVPAILETVCRVTGLRFAAVARVTESKWTACAVRDEIEFGMKPGDELEIATTFCDRIRVTREPVMFDHAAEDPGFREHPSPKMYGFQSYISMPIVRTNGEFFGTLCALDPLPAKVSDPTIVATLKLFTELIAMHLDSRERLARSEAALLDAGETAELREHFIAVLGHDLRNPLAAIEAGTRMLARMELEPRATQIVLRMQESCRRMAGLIGDVLDFARGKLGGGLTLHRSPDQDLAASLEQVVGELRAVHPARTIEARIAIPAGLSCDAARIGQLLSNLLANALTHGDADAPVRVIAERRDGMLRIEVANRGRRIERSKLQKLFQPFSRGEHGSHHEGLGLGLYISSEIARAHGGTLEVSSTDEETVFTFAAPAGDEAAVDGRESAARSEYAVETSPT
jgi:signal transduction histidine kinase